MEETILLLRKLSRHTTQNVAVCQVIQKKKDNVIEVDKLIVFFSS